MNEVAIALSAQPLWHGFRTYRSLYILNWIYRYMTEPNYRQWLGEAWAFVAVGAARHRVVSHTRGAAAATRN